MPGLQPQGLRQPLLGSFDTGHYFKVERWPGMSLINQFSILHALVQLVSMSAVGWTEEELGDPELAGGGVSA